MSENLERIELDEELEEMIAGGTIGWRFSEDNMYHVYSDSDPSAYLIVQEGKVLEAKKFVLFKCKGKSDAETLSLLKENGYVY